LFKTASGDSAREAVRRDGCSFIDADGRADDLSASPQRANFTNTFSEVFLMLLGMGERIGVSAFGVSACRI
jgi:hypothetical protein